MNTKDELIVTALANLHNTLDNMNSYLTAMNYDLQSKIVGVVPYIPTHAALQHAHHCVTELNQLIQDNENHTSRLRKDDL